MKIRHFLFFAAIFVATPSFAATYKCKDKSGQWTEEACPDFEERRIQKGRKILEEQARREWKPHIGMQSSEVTKMLKHPDCRTTTAFKWCGYWDVNTTKTSRGTREQWVFRRGHGADYLYFENGILVTIQE